MEAAFTHQRTETTKKRLENQKKKYDRMVEEILFDPIESEHEAEPIYINGSYVYLACC